MMKEKCMCGRALYSDATHNISTRMCGEMANGGTGTYSTEYIEYGGTNCTMCTQQSTYKFKEKGKETHAFHEFIIFGG